MMIGLDQALLNHKCIVVQLKKDSSLIQRFLDIGIVPGMKIMKVLESPFGGICAYSVMSSTIAIRDVDAKGILVEYE